MSDPAPDVEDQQIIGAEAAPVSESETEKQQAVAEYSKSESNGQLSMLVKVHSPFRDYYDGQAFSISAENTTGPFDILPKHHNFISLLSPCDLIIRTVSKGEETIRISGGIMHVKADRVIVFLDV
jgi:ATP synthase, Delta/Epsilon chain, beta-sandwich domain